MRSRLTTGMEDSKDDEKGARYQRGREHCSAHYTRRQLALHSSVLPATTAPGRSTASLTRSRTHSSLHGRTSQYKSNLATQSFWSNYTRLCIAFAFDILIHN